MTVEIIQKYLRVGPMNTKVGAQVLAFEIPVNRYASRLCLRVTFMYVRKTEKKERKQKKQIKSHENKIRRYNIGGWGIKLRYFRSVHAVLYYEGFK